MVSKQKIAQVSAQTFFRKQALNAEKYNLIESENPIRLHQNEGLPWPSGLAAQEMAVQGMEILLEALISERSFNLYPNLVPTKLTRAFAKYLEIPEENIEVTSGSSQGLCILAQACFEPGRTIAITSPSFSLFEGYAKLYGAEIVPIFLSKNYSFTREAIFSLEVLATDVAIFCSPNNPTGGIVPYDWLCEFSDKYSGLVVVDEAYFEFAHALGFKSFLQECITRPNVLVLRTLSKAWGAAGLRVGAMIASKPLIKVFSALTPPYSVPFPSDVLATWFLQKRQQDLADRVKITLAEKVRVETFLQSIPGIELFQSHANFVCFTHVRAAALEFHLRTEHSILIRFYMEPRLQNFIRANVWTPESNTRFLQCTKDFLT